MAEKTDNRKKHSRGVWDFMKSRGRIWLLVGGVVLGVILLLFGSGYGEDAEKDADGAAAVTESTAELRSYREKLEKEVETLCDAVRGVSSVEVLVSLESGYRVIYTTDGKGDPATVGSGSGQQALYRTLQPPAVSGVAVVCHGGDSPALQRTLTELVSTALGIASNRVCIAGK